jgi:hypothetical protein
MNPDAKAQASPDQCDKVRRLPLPLVEFGQKVPSVLAACYDFSQTDTMVGWDAEAKTSGSGSWGSRDYGTATWECGDPAWDHSRS